MPKKRYRVALSEDDCAHLLDRLGQGARSTREQTRVRILLKVDEDPSGSAWPDDQTAEALEVAALKKRL